VIVSFHHNSFDLRTVCEKLSGIYVCIVMLVVRWCHVLGHMVYVVSSGLAELKVTQHISRQTVYGLWWKPVAQSRGNGTIMLRNVRNYAASPVIWTHSNCYCMWFIVFCNWPDFLGYLESGPRHVFHSGSTEKQCEFICCWLVGQTSVSIPHDNTVCGEGLFR